jgi:hypothetical protein
MSQTRKAPVIANVELLPKQSLLGIQIINCNMSMEIDGEKQVYQAAGIEVGIIFIKFIFIYTW